MTKKTGLTILGVGLGINVIDYFTSGTPIGSTTSSGGIFYKTGGPLASVPWLGLALIGVGGVIYLMK